MSYMSLFRKTPYIFIKSSNRFVSNVCDNNQIFKRLNVTPLKTIPNNLYRLPLYNQDLNIIMSNPKDDSLSININSRLYPFEISYEDKNWLHEYMYHTNIRKIVINKYFNSHYFDIY